jgi:rsbT antagonist protein RsbS
VFVSILAQGDFLIASIHAALDDAELVQFQEDVIREVGARRAQGVIIDVGALDVLDSFASRSLRDLAAMARLRGAATVIVGVQPDVAFSIVRLGMDLQIHSALGLEEGFEYLEATTSGRRGGRSNGHGITA